MKGEIYALLAAFTWGSALVLFKRGGERTDPAQLNLLKNLFALLLFSITLPWEGPFLAPFSKITPTETAILCLSGILGIAVADSLLFAALKRLSVTMFSVVDCLYSPAIILFSWLLLGEQIGPSHILGAACIVGGILIPNKPPAPSHGSSQLGWGIIFGISAIVLMAVSIVMAKPILQKLPLLWSTQLRLLAGSLVLSLWIFGRGEVSPREFFRPKPEWRFLLPGAFLGTYISMIFWIGGFKYANASIAGLLNQSSIVFAILLSAIFLRETMTPRKVIAVLMALSGTALVALRPF